MSQGSTFGNTDLSVMTPSVIALIAIIGTAVLCAVIASVVLLERKFGAVQRRRRFEVSDIADYKRMVEKLSATGRLMRRKSMYNELKAIDLDHTNCDNICGVCTRCVADANFGSARTMFFWAMKDGAPEYLCIDCFAHLDVQEYGEAKKLQDEWQTAAEENSNSQNKSATADQPLEDIVATRPKSVDTTAHKDDTQDVDSPVSRETADTEDAVAASPTKKKKVKKSLTRSRSSTY